ncbi:MAG: tight adherence protein [Solirubrobacteraceae bacterium]|nr:tight adherence protein [Solirubrobacteraceae bacterium]
MFGIMVIGLLFVVLCATMIARAVALPRQRALERVGEMNAYGFHADAVHVEEAPGHVTGGVERFARSVGTLATRLVAFNEPALRRELASAGLYRLSPLTLTGYRVLAAVGLPLLLLWYGGVAGLAASYVVLGLPLVGAIGWIGPVTFVRRRARMRLSDIDDELPELVDLIVVTVEAGVGFSGSLQVAGQRIKGPLGDELRLALREQSMGLPTEQAMANLLERADTDGMRSFVRAVRQGERLGVSIGQIMRDLAGEMRKRRHAKAEERAQKAPIKILFPLVVLIFPALFVVLLAPALLRVLETFGGGS